jgi:transposase InsO family protein
LVLEALEMALSQRRPESVIHHSQGDVPSPQGCQYTATAFGRRCREAGVIPYGDDASPVGSVGDCYDNAMAESLADDTSASPRWSAS